MTSRSSIAPPESFRKLPATERRRIASDLLAGFQEGLNNLIASRSEFTDLQGFIAYVKVKAEVEASIVLWRREMHRAAWDSKHRRRSTGTGRSPVIKAHGCAAASLAGSFFDALNQSGNARKVAT